MHQTIFKFRVILSHLLTNHSQDHSKVSEALKIGKVEKIWIF